MEVDYQSGPERPRSKGSADLITEVTQSALDDTIYMWDISWWRPITLKNVDGTFAMEISAFKKYFAGFGVVS